MIEIKNIYKSYGSAKILEDICLSVSAGECVGIVGANGSGKTTLLSIVSGLLSCDSGSILVDGKVISDSPKHIAEYISYVPQENPLIDELTAFDNLRLWYSGNKEALREELSGGILHQLGIDEFQSKPVSKLSGGMKKRLSIGIALLGNPKLLIMDEPSAALDLAGKYQIREYMKHFTSQLDYSIIVVSHDQNELSACDKLYLLKNSRLSPIETGTDDKTLIQLISGSEDTNV